MGFFSKLFGKNNEVRAGKEEVTPLEAPVETVEEAAVEEAAVEETAEEVDPVALAEKKQRQKEKREKQIQKVMDATGWDRAKVLELMKQAKKDLGVSYTDYAKLKLYDYSEEEQKKVFQAYVDKREKKKKAQALRDQLNLDQPFGGKISNITNEGIEYYWKKVELADGYEVFRSYEEEGAYESIYVAPKRNIGTYIDGDFDHSKKRVYYKVRSYRKKMDGSVDYSDLTEATEAVYQENMTLSREATYMFSGITRSIYALHGWGQPGDGVWESTDPSVCTIDQNGVITGVGKGECEIRFTSAQIGQTAVSKVIVDREAEDPLAPITSRFVYDQASETWKNPDSQASGEAVIMMVGDLMCSSVQMRNQYSPKQGYCFNDSYHYVKEVMKDSDFAVANLETLLSPGWPYMIDEAYIDNYNNCNAPARYLDAVKYGGFDAVMMANNHNCDGGVRALMETIDQVDRYRFARSGAYTGKEKHPYFIAEINGIKVGFLAYITQATGFNYKELSWTEEERNRHLSIFDPERAKKEIQEARDAGAEYVIVYMHWGMKNFYNLTAGQTRDSQAIADAGADFILGANPHVLQKYEVITAQDGKQVPCYYSAGNYQAVMNQVEGNRETIVVRIVLKKEANGKVILEKNQYIPSYAYRQCGLSKWAPVVVSGAYNKTAVKPKKAKILEHIRQTIGEQAELL